MKLKYWFALLCCGSLPLGAANTLPNSSFELGFAANEIIHYVVKGGKAPKIGISEKEAFHGKRSLAITANNSSDYWEVCASEAPMPKPGKYTFSVYMKADRPVNIRIFCLGYAHRPPEVNEWYGSGYSVRVGKEWKRYSVTFSVKAHRFITPMIISDKANTAGTVYIDAMQFEPGGAATDYAPSAPVEAALDNNGEVLGFPGKRSLKMTAVSYNAASPFEAVLTDGRKVRMDLAAGTTAEKTIDVNLNKKGLISFGGKFTAGEFTGAVEPISCSIVSPLPKSKLTLDDFFVGLNGAWSALNLRYCMYNNYHPYFWEQVDRYSQHGKITIKELYDDIGKAGFKMLRLHDHHLGNWPIHEPEKGKFDFKELDEHVDAMKSAGIEPMYRLEGFVYEDKWKLATWRHPRAQRNMDWFAKKNGKRGEKVLYGSGIYAGYPDMQDWRDYVSTVVKHFKGRIRFYEVYNEPNLCMPDAKRYSEYLKAAFEEIRKADPSALVVGICATGDFSANLQEFTGQCGKNDAFKHLDIMSFHPYSAQLDTSALPAEQQLKQIRSLTDQFRKNVPLWNDEMYYIRSAREAARYGNHHITQATFPASNAIRRYIIDWSSGIKGTMPTHFNGIFEAPRQPNFATSQERLSGRPAYSERMTSTNALVSLVGGTKVVKKLDNLNSDINGALFVRKDGNQVAALWGRELDDSFTYTLPAGVKVYDLFGNPVTQKEQELTSDVRYFVGMDLEKKLSGIFNSKMPFLIPAAHETVGGINIYVRNRSNHAVDLMLRPVKVAPKKTVHLAGNSSTKVFFPVKKGTELPKVLPVIVSDGDIMTEVKVPFFPHRSIVSGKTMKIGKNAVGKMTMSADALSFKVTVKDQTRFEAKSEAWMNDGLEVFIDSRIDDSPEREHYVGGTYRIFLNPAGDGKGVRVTTSPNWKASDFKSSIKDTADGFTVECVIPWKALKLNKAPEEIGFDFCVNDAAKGRNRISSYWGGKDDNHKNRFSFGRIKRQK